MNYPDSYKNVNNMHGIYTCEQVSDGHPDKLCVQIADAIVRWCLLVDENSRVAIECLLKDNHLIIAGELKCEHKPPYKRLVDRVLDRIGRGKLGYTEENSLDIQVLVSEQSSDIALGVDKGGAGDQGIMYGYSTNETPDMLPIPFVLATSFLRDLKREDSIILGADAKAQVTFDYDTGKIKTFLCSVQHSTQVEVGSFRPMIEALMMRATFLYDLNRDFEILVNPTGRFVTGGSFADCGVTGRKLACDTYGGIGRIGGGALSGKDPSKVDRSAAYMARKIANDIVNMEYADRCEIQLAYAIGIAEPVSIAVECFGTGKESREFLERYIRKNYDLTPSGIIKALDLKRVDYTRISSYGHFGDNSMPWEED